MDHAFRNVMENIFGREAMDYLHFEENEDELEMLQQFEFTKRVIFSKEEKVNVSVGFPLTRREKVKKCGKDVPTLIEKSPYNGRGIKYGPGKLRIPTDIFKEMIQSTLDKIVGHIRAILQERPDIKTLVLVGGFSNCSLVQHQIRQKFEVEGKTRVVIPDECELAVMKGAVYIGHPPPPTWSRVAETRNRLSCLLKI